MTPLGTEESDMDPSPDVVDRWMARVNADAEFKLVSRWTDVRFDVLRDGERRRYRVQSSTLSRADHEAEDGDVISLQGSAEAWGAFLAPVPARHCHNLLAMDRRRDDFAIATGRHRLIQNLRVIDLVFDLLRSSASDGSTGR